MLLINNHQNTKRFVRSKLCHLPTRLISYFQWVEITSSKSWRICDFGHSYYYTINDIWYF